ncbi:hypothetical protein DFH09DRAFT_1097231 [Mycena vulgaris]|nr:hypothetical protein DFH09DRAFT_1097231 [Mycena vulgaris]
MWSSAYLFTVLATVLAVVSAAPADIGPDASENLTLCTNNNFVGACLAIPIVPDGCQSFIGGFTIMNKELSSAVIPDGFILLSPVPRDFGCLSTGSNGQDEVALQGGSFANFAAIPGVFAAQNFDNDASSYSCSVI